MPSVRALAAAILLATPACDAGRDALGEGLRMASVRSIREISAAEARAWVEHSGATVVRETGASAETPLPPGGAPVVVIARNPDDGLRVAARLIRSGTPRVGVVRGGLEAWQAEQQAAAAPARPQGG